MNLPAYRNKQVNRPKTQSKVYAENIFTTKHFDDRLIKIRRLLKNKPPHSPWKIHLMEAAERNDKTITFLMCVLHRDKSG